MSAEAWVTLATNDSYALGALVLAHSLRRVGTTRRLVALITPGVTDAMRHQLVCTFDLVEVVNVLDSRDSTNLALLSRPDLGVTFTKLHCWRLTQFTKCVFLDADTLVLQPCDELFDREELSAAPDAGWPDCFNSGVFVYRPSNETYAKLLEFGVSHGSFDGGDQGLLNSFFSDWATKDISRHLPFIYNMCSSAIYSYLPAFKKFGETVRIAHFIGACKPWMQAFDSETQQVRASPGQEHQLMLLQLWWDIFCKNVHPHLTSDMRHGTPQPFPQTNAPPPPPPPPPLPIYHGSSEKSAPTPPPVVSPCLTPSPSHHHTPCVIEERPRHIVTSQLPFYARAHILPQSYPPILMRLNNSPAKTATDMLGGDGEMVMPCMEVTSQPRIPIVPQTTHPSLELSSVCLPVTTVTMGVEEDEASLRPLQENAGVVPCAQSSPEAEGGLAAAFSRMTLGSPKTDAQRAMEDQVRREAWERGQVDYLGKDSFDNVWMKIMQTLTSGPSTPAAGPPPAPVAPAPVAPAPVAPAPVAPAPVPPAPVAPAPVAPAPVAPAPVAPAPVAPAPVAPAPVAPAPVAPAPVAPAPVAPAPVAPAPVAPAPVAPTPVAPAPMAPTPVAPAPVAPQPVAPAPVPLAPVAPAPVAPAPVTPAPVVPAPAAPVAPLPTEPAAPAEPVPPAPSVPLPAPKPTPTPTQQPSPAPQEPPKSPKSVTAVSTPLLAAKALPSPVPADSPASPPQSPPPDLGATPQSPTAKQKPAAATAKQAQAKAGQGPPQAGDEAGAQGAAPVAPKRKGGQQQQAGSGKGGGKSGGQKGKK